MLIVDANVPVLASIPIGEVVVEGRRIKTLRVLSVGETTREPIFGAG